MRHLANQMGNVDDIKCALKHNSYTLTELKAAWENEESKEAPRQTVIKLLVAAIRRTLKKAVT